MKKEIIYAILLPLFLISSLLFAEETQNNNNNNNNNIIEENKFKINIDDVSTKRIDNRYKRYKAIMNDTYDMKILLKPLVVPLMNVYTIYGHHNFISTLIFPDSFKIISATTTIPMKQFTYSKNVLMLSPKKDTDIGNIVITAYDYETKVNKIFNFMFKPYSLTSLKFDTEYGMYATDVGDFFSFTTKFVQMPNINPVKVLQKYIETFGINKFNKVFSKNGYYDSVLIDNIPVYIIRDEEDGNIVYFNKKFRISIGVKQ